MNWNKYSDDMLSGCLSGIMKVGAGIMLLASIIWLSSCKHIEYVTVPQVHTDTLYISKTQHDSIHIRDSVWVHEYTKGDTVYVEQLRWKTEWRERVKTDTLHETRVDSVAVPYPVVKIETKHHWGGWVAFGALIAAIVALIILKRKKIWE